ncbi:LacI family DNA-binding transcriptional regulator [Pelagicoccus sp. SDUM812005]|uniref:LacI family DNA-binding transcriptional regulator n=1 Tax=Pelagicoccus sp. SDUM812005 TaxID=3041257 RepID=UPI00280DF8CC|nr:LacI family DNA-binding transcriptional regulator [Pelagicoccus sp. SDUM812005]MDQ8182956.1 LacI family DNA-binding transcriptional regulator [Pelagicoccus sp. SDUM812005]
MRFPITRHESDMTQENRPSATSSPRVTLRDIANEMGVSHVTVSKALRGLSGVSESLRKRIQQKAEQMQYTPDPMLASLSRYRFTKQDNPIHSELAWINTWRHPDRIQEHKEFTLYWEGAKEGARRLGYRLQTFHTAEVSPKRLKEILDTRNIRGVLLPPERGQSEALQPFNWSDYALVRFGQSHNRPKIHSVGSAQFSNTVLAYEKARELGYRRIGFVCEYRPLRLFGAGYEWAQKTAPKGQQIPLLAFPPSAPFEKQQDALQKWLTKNGPDAILTDNSETLSMLQNLGYRIPQDIGLATTSIHDTVIDTGIDQCPYEIGRAAVRMLTALIAEKSFGIPSSHNDSLIEGKWVQGAMLPPR